MRSLGDPMKAKCFDPDFKYVPANETDIRKTFERERQRLAQQQQQPGNVKSLPTKRKA